MPPPKHFQENSMAPFAVFLEKDQLSLGGGWSLIRGNDAFFLEVDTPEFSTWSQISKIGIVRV